MPAETGQGGVIMNQETKETTKETKETKKKKAVLAAKVLIFCFFIFSEKSNKTLKSWRIIVYSYSYILTSDERCRCVHSALCP